MAVAPFRLEQGWASEAGTGRLFRFGAPLPVLLCFARGLLGSSVGLPSSSSWPLALVEGWFGT